MLSLTAEPIFRQFCMVGECPTWDERTSRLIWTDIEGRCLWQGDPDRPGALEQIAVGARVGAFGLRKDGGLVLGTDAGFRLQHDDLQSIAFPGMRDGIRLNDGRVDPFGHFVCGGVVEIATGTTGLFRLSARGDVETLLTGIRCANGSCWSADGETFYFTDTPTRTLQRFAYRPFGEGLGAGDIVTTFAADEGWPDGATVDEEGCIWVAMWGSGSVIRLSPQGERIGVVRLPTANATCPAFGGADRRTLFVTTEGGKLTAEQRAAQPFAGFVCAVAMPVAGRPEWRFG